MYIFICFEMLVISNILVLHNNVTDEASVSKLSLSDQ